MLQVLKINSIGDAIGFLFVFCCCGLPVLLFLGLFISAQREHRRLMAAVANVTDEQRIEVLRLVKEATPAEPTVFNLIPTGDSTGDDSTLIRLPRNIPRYPWGGRCVTVEKTSEMDFVWSFVESDFEGIAIRGQIYRLEGVPRRITKKGKERNVFDKRELLKCSPELKALVTELFPESPEKLLREVLPKSYPSLGQIGGSPTWQQQPEFLRCEICGKHMVLIMQLEEESIDDEGHWMCYFFGCRAHPESTASEYQGT